MEPNSQSDLPATLSPAEKSLGRAAACQFLGGLLLEGVTPALLDQVREIPLLAGALPEPAEPDHLAAAHYSLFQLNVFPYETIFLDSANLLGGPASERIAAAYRDLNYLVETNTVHLDHVAVELGALAHVCRLEARAISSGNSESIRSIQRRGLAFLDRHLLQWILPLALAIQSQKHSFYTALSQLLLELLAELVGEWSGLESAASKTSRLEDAPAILESDKTGLKDIAGYLAVATHCGVFLSRQQIGELAREVDLPRGFGSRSQMLLTLLESASRYERVSALLARLDILLEGAEAYYQGGGGHKANLGCYGRPWRLKAAGTRELLRRMSALIEADTST